MESWNGNKHKSLGITDLLQSVMPFLCLLIFQFVLKCFQHSVIQVI